MRAFLDAEGEGLFETAVAIVVFKGGIDFDVEKTVGAIELLDGDAILNEELFAETAAAVAEAGSGLNLHALAERGGVKVTIAGDGEGDELVALAAVDAVLDEAAVLLQGIGVIDLGIEPALVLERAGEYAAALEEQRGLHGAFLVDGKQLAEPAVGEAGARGADVDARAGFDGEAGDDTVGGSVVGHAFEVDAGEQEVLLLKEAAHAVEARLDTAF